MGDGRGLHLGQSVRVGDGDEIGLIVDRGERGFEVRTEQGRAWHAAGQLTPAPVPARLLEMAVEALQDLAARHWGESPPSDELRLEDDDLRRQLDAGKFDQIETRPLGFNQLWVENDPPPASGDAEA